MSKRTHRVAVLGAGNGGQAIAGHLSDRGYSVRLWNRSKKVLDLVKATGQITLTGVLSSTATIDIITHSLEEAVVGAEIILITTTANAHYDLAVALAPLLEDGQIVVLNPGRTLGALEFRQTIRRHGCVDQVYVAEAQSLVFACRLMAPAQVRVIGVKEYVPLAAFPAIDTAHVLSHVKPLFHCFAAAPHILYTSLENIGAIFHPAIVMFNAATIERGEEFYFYQDMTESVANFLMTLDEERLALGEAFGIHLASIFDWIKIAYPDCVGNTLTERMRTNPAYHEIKAPTRLASRLILEDIPTGLVPFAALGQIAGLEMSLTRSLIQVTSILVGRDFWSEGRNLDKLNLAGMKPNDILQHVTR